MAKQLPPGWKRYPVNTVERTEINPEDLFSVGLGELAGMEGLEGWGIFKKVGRFFKKVGNKIKKLKLKSALKIAIPLTAAVGLGPLTGLAVSKLSKKFGPKMAKLVKGGRTMPRVVQITRKGKTFKRVVLLNKSEASLAEKLYGSAKKILTEEAIKKITPLIPIEKLTAPPNVVPKENEIELPVSGDSVQSEVETISAEPSFMKRHGKKILIGAGVAVGGLTLLKMTSRRR